jgi:hypothetical protein
MIVKNDVQKLLLFIRGELLFEVAHHVLQHIGVLFHRAFQAERFEEKDFVGMVKIFLPAVFCLGHQFSHGPIFHDAVAHDLKFVACMKGHQPSLVSPFFGFPPAF